MHPDLRQTRNQGLETAQFPPKIFKNIVKAPLSVVVVKYNNKLQPFSPPQIQLAAAQV